jgi:phenylpyruvate tautomerase PptA (4-oxalocrotonate tautomerase family)
MPLIQVRVIKDVFAKEQNRHIIGKLTEAMVSIEGENSFTNIRAAAASLLCC